MFWFKADAKEMIARIWEMVAILREEGIHVHKHWTHRPGTVVYSDTYQVAAIPFRRHRRA